MSIRFRNSFLDSEIESIMNSIPKFAKESVDFFRREKEGFISIRSNRLPRMQELFFNHTAQEIFEMCDGINTTSQIVLFMREKYKLEYEEAKKDVLDILFALSRFQFIDWIRDEGFMENKIIVQTEDYRVTVVDESEVRELLNFFKRSNECVQYTHILTNKDIYSEELFLREALFSYTEDFYVIKYGNEIKGVVSIKYNNNTNSTVASIGIMSGSIENIRIILKKIVSSSNNISEFKAKKIKVQFIRGNMSEKILKLFEEQNFVLEYIAKCELNGNDIETYSYFF